MLAVLGLDLDLGRLLASLLLFSQTHTPLDDSHIPRLLQLELDLPSHLLLAVAHLHNGVLDGLALDLVSQLDKLLGAGCEERRFARQLALSASNPVGTRLLAEGICPIPNLSNNHLALPSFATARVRINSPCEMFLGEGSSRGSGIARLPYFSHLFSGSGGVNVEFLGLGLGELIVEDRLAFDLGAEVLHQLLARILGPCEVGLEAFLLLLLSPPEPLGLRGRVEAPGVGGDGEGLESGDEGGVVGRGRRRECRGCFVWMLEVRRTIDSTGASQFVSNIDLPPLRSRLDGTLRLMAAPMPIALAHALVWVCITA